MKSRFLIFTLFLAVMCIGASNTMAQSATGTGVGFFIGPEHPPLTLTVSAQVGGNGGVMRFGVGQDQIIANPVDICVQGNIAFVVAEITQANGTFAGSEGQFMQWGFQDNGGSGDLVLGLAPFFIVPFQIPACDLVPVIAFPIERGGYHVKSE